MRCCLARIFISVSECKVSRTSIIRAFFKRQLSVLFSRSHYGNRIPITVAEFSVSLSSEHLSVFLLTWKEVVREDCQARKLNKEDAMDRCKWRKMIKEAR